MKYFLLTLGIIIYLATLTYVVSSSQADANTPTCYDDDGKPVDWYIVYKIPQMRDKPKPFMTGYAYAFITSDDLKSATPTSNSFKSSPQSPKVADKPGGFINRIKNIFSGNQRNSLSERMQQASNNETRPRRDTGKLYWTISEKLLSDSNSLVQRTLDIAYNRNRKGSNRINAILYNDAPPDNDNNSTSHSRAHAKGVVIIDDVSGDGVWLTHSTPLYPPKLNQKLHFGPTTKKNGQTFMCLNFDAKRAGSQVVDHLVTMYPMIYDSYISKKLKDIVPNINELTLEDEKTRRKTSVIKRAQIIKTREGQDLYIYSKSAKFGDDLYSGWITNEIKSPLYVESWRIANKHALNSSCPRNQYHVNNVQDMHVVDGGDTISWSYTKDHSKWAISDEVDPGVVCITDINRAESQFTRGGGAVCIKSPIVWNVFSKTIEDLEPCPKDMRPQPINV